MTTALFFYCCLIRLQSPIMSSNVVDSDNCTFTLEIDMKMKTLRTLLACTMQWLLFSTQAFPRSVFCLKFHPGSDSNILPACSRAAFCVRIGSTFCRFLVVLFVVWQISGLVCECACEAIQWSKNESMVPFLERGSPRLFLCGSSLGHTSTWYAKMCSFICTLDIWYMQDILTT